MICRIYPMQKTEISSSSSSPKPEKKRRLKKMTCGRLPKYGNAFTKTGGPDIAITGIIKKRFFFPGLAAAGMRHFICVRSRRIFLILAFVPDSNHGIPAPLENFRSAIIFFRRLFSESPGFFSESRGGQNSSVFYKPKVTMGKVTSNSLVCL